MFNAIRNWFTGAPTLVLGDPIREGIRDENTAVVTARNGRFALVANDKIVGTYTTKSNAKRAATRRGLVVEGIGG
jgi:hypothetical protein